MKGKLTGFDALGWMLTEEGSIIAIRNEAGGVGFRYDLEEMQKSGISIPADQLRLEGWELGSECPKCIGSGEISVPCPQCSGRSLHSLLENPCCDGWTEKKCSECGGEGITWRDEY